MRLIFISLLLVLATLCVQAQATGSIPIYEETGKPEADAPRYDAAKRAWITANPEQYQQMSGSTKEQVDAITGKKEETPTASEKKTTAPPPTMEGVKWTLVDVQVRDVLQKTSPADLAANGLACCNMTIHHKQPN